MGVPSTGVTKRSPAMFAVGSAQRRLDLRDVPRAKTLLGHQIEQRGLDCALEILVQLCGRGVAPRKIDVALDRAVCGASLRLHVVALGHERGLDQDLDDAGA